MKAKIGYKLLVIILALLPYAATAQEVGTIKYARGAVTVQKPDGSDARLAGKDDLIMQGEVIKTGPKSFAIISLKDDTRMTLRPKTTFAVEQINTRKDSKATAILRLFRGGLRTITGFISKFNPGGYKIKTNVATIGIRGTEFDVRLCEHDCAQESKELEKKEKKDIAQTIARAVFIRGGLTADAYAGRTRVLQTGGSIYEGDTLKTDKNSYAILVFRDKSRVSLQANTIFRVDELKFDEKEEAKRSALFSLLKGGLRTITGLIGKLNPKRYSMRTKVATIGIRGTGYDLMCTGECESKSHSMLDKSTPKLQEAIAGGKGLHGYVWDGTINFGGQLLHRGQAGYRKNKASDPVVLPTVPDYFLQNPVPRPDTFKVDESKLFVKSGKGKSDPGAYLVVTSGTARITAIRTKRSLTIGPDFPGPNIAFAGPGGQTVEQLPIVPIFLRLDTTPKPSALKAGKVSLGAGLGGDDDKKLICEVK